MLALRSIWKTKSSQLAMTHLKEKSKGEGFSLLRSKVVYKDNMALA